MRYYILEEKNTKPATAEEFTKWLQKYGYLRFLREDEINGYLLSTIFLHIDHNCFDEGPPILFETMFFGPDGYEQERYHTYDEAIEGHEKWLNQLKSVKKI